MLKNMVFTIINSEKINLNCVRKPKINIQEKTLQNFTQPFLTHMIKWFKIVNQSIACGIMIND